MKTLKNIVPFIFYCIAISTYAQVGINTDGSSPNPSAILDVKSSTMGVLMPRMTNVERDAIVSPVEGLIIFNSDEKKLQIFNGSVWTYLNLDPCVPSMPGNISGPAYPDCNQAGVGYSIASVSWASYYKWIVPSGATIVGGQGTTSITVDFTTQSGTIYVRAESGCGNSSYRTLPIVIGIPATPGTITGPAHPECYSSGVTYSIDAVPGALTYTWNVPAGATLVSGQGTTSITVDYASPTSGNVSVRAENSCGNSSYSTLGVNIAIPSAPGTISGNMYPDANGTGEIYSISEVNGATSYNWTVPTGSSITSGQGTTSITVDFGTTSGDISVRAENSCGNSSYTSSAITLFECGNPKYDSRDGQFYNTTMIGSQCWFAENLNVGTFLNYADPPANNGYIEKYCYDNNPANCDQYGGLYQWDEMMQYTSLEGVQGICPDGWHIPSDDEWEVLEGYADSQYDYGDPIWDNTGYRGSDAGGKLKSTSGWDSGGNGTDAYGFNAKPGGYYTFGDGTFYLGQGGTFWSSTLYDYYYAWHRFLFYDTQQISKSAYGTEHARSVRCLKD
jgi:uncharacterized protein (TIGR02145 family)